MTRWHNTSGIRSQQYTCAFCSSLVGPSVGYGCQKLPSRSIYICPKCDKPTFMNGPVQTPAPLLGTSIENVPPEIDSLYNEARACTGAKAYTAAVLACRKILMHIAVDKGATPGAKFIEYVKYLGDKHYVPPGSEDWVDHIRNKGNEANHEIAIMTDADALDLISFVEMLLRLIYEFPARMLKKPQVTKKP